MKGRSELDNVKNKIGGSKEDDVKHKVVSMVAGSRSVTFSRQCPASTGINLYLPDS